MMLSDFLRQGVTVSDFSDAGGMTVSDFSEAGDDCK